VTLGCPGLRRSFGILAGQCPFLGPRLLLLASLTLPSITAGCGDGSLASHPTPPVSTVESNVGVHAFEIASGLDRPVYVAAAPGEPGRLYVVGQAGVIQVLERGKLNEQPFLDISALTTTSPKEDSAAEQGLLSMAFAPDYATSGRFYVDYTDRDGDVNVVEYRARHGRADPNSARRLLLVEKHNTDHNGGQLQVGPDGGLYVGIGDDEEGRVHAQSLEPGDLLGKIVRLDPEGPQVVAYGLRNPWRFSFDRETGDLWIGDVGEVDWEEVSRVPSSERPANLGWAVYEGHEAGDGDSKTGDPGRLVWPTVVYSHDKGGCAVIGGYVYRGEAIAAARDRYFYGDFCAGTIWSVDPADPESIRHELDLGTTLASFGEDAHGELYLVSRTGSIYRISD
jgi:glucose/arabinose dehydrogenase